MASGKVISARALETAYQKQKDAQGNENIDNVKLLQDYNVISADKKPVMANVKSLMETFAGKPEQMMGLFTGELKAISSGSADKQKELGSSSGVQNNDEMQLSGEKVVLSNEESINRYLAKKAISLNVDGIRAHLESFIKTITWGEDSYTSGEILIKKMKNCSDNLQNLVVAGTRILDALIYMSMKDDQDGMKLFLFEELLELNEDEALRRMKSAKDGIQACIIYAYTQGAIPSKGEEGDRNVPGFIKKLIYQDETITGERIANELSSASTRKFPSRVFIQIGMDLLPTPVAARSKLNIAGNKAVRYAAFTSIYEVKDKPTEPDHRDEVAYRSYKKENKKLKRANEIFNALRRLDGDFTLQLKMHPLNPEKPSVSKLTLKLTCALMFRLTVKGRMDVRNKIIAGKIGSYQRDSGIYGLADDNGSVSWPILDDPDADFIGMGDHYVEKLYGMTITLDD